MARRKALKWQKWETNHADAAILAAPRPVLRFHFCDGSLLQRPASENEHKTQDIPPAASLRITYTFNHKNPRLLQWAPTLQHSFLAFPFAHGWQNDPLVKLCFGFSNHTSFKKKNNNFKVPIMATSFFFFFLSGQILRWIKKESFQSLQRAYCFIKCCWH